MVAIRWKIAYIGREANHNQEDLAMMTTRLFEQALHIDRPWKINEVSFDQENRRLDIHIDFKRGATFHYEDDEAGVSGNFKAYDTVMKTWRHLNFFEHECYLHCRTPRIRTNEDKVRLISPPWAGVNSGFTMLFECLLLQLCSQMPVNAVASMVNETDDKLWRMLDKYVMKAREQEDFSEVTAVGMDETSRAGHHDYLSLFVDLDHRRTLFIAEGKDSSTVDAFSKDFKEHDGRPEKVTNVSCDMSPAFINGVSESLPNAEITFDKFHVMKIINEAVDTVRKNEVHHNSILRKTKYLFLKNRENLASIQLNRLEALENMPKLNLKTIRALHIRENFQEIYKANDEAEFERLLKKWYFWATHSRIEPIKQAAYTIKRHWYGVLNWRLSKISNGILEGLNSLVQAAKAKARGYRTFRCLRIITYLMTAKLDFEKINPSYKPLNAT
jgi:transposase